MAAHELDSSPDAEDLSDVLAADQLALVDDGPGAGRVLAVGRRVVSVGRGPGRVDLEDPLLSRDHLELRARSGRVEARDPGSRHGTRRAGTVPGRRGRLLGPRWEPVALGTTLLAGAGSVRVTGGAGSLAAPRPVVLPPGGRRGLRAVARLAPMLLAPLVMVPLLLGSSAGPWRFAILGVPVLAVGIWLLAERDPASRVPPRPAASEVLLLAAAGLRPVGGPADVLVLRFRSGPHRRGRALRGGRRHLPGGEPRRRGEARRGGASRRRSGGGSRSTGDLRLSPGDVVGLTGPGGARAARWLLAQVLTHEPTATASVPAGWALPSARRAPSGTGTSGSDAAAQPGPRGQPWHVSVVAAGPDARAPEAAAGRRHLVLAVAGDRPPAWCTRIVVTGPHDGVSPTWAGRHARALEVAGGEGESLPSSVHLTDLLGPLTPVAVRRRWSAGHGLRVPVGRGTEGPVEVDLVAEGPHALLAGATGAGKSEALTSWLVALAATCSPTDLAMVLVDYKGGSAFAPLAPLPHVSAVLTDLDPAATVRALTSLGAELRRRERVLADAGAKDLGELYARGGSLPRLLVVVDEFRALADDHPQLLADLVRLAAQGRSLGLHLVLATQRPSGIVGPDVRANITVRLCLRVLEAADSRDVVGTARAAELPAVPGRAVLRTDAAREVQVAWLGPTGSGLPADAVAAVRAAAEGTAAPAVPWAPELPVAVAAGGINPATGVPLPSTAVALVDEPGRLALEPWCWDGSALLVLGGPGTGRTTALRALGAAAARDGRTVHVVGGHDAVGSGAATGTLAPPDDPRLVLRLLEVLGGAAAAPGQMLLIDDVELLLDRLDAALGPGQSLAALPTALRGVLSRGHHVALAGSPASASARWAEVGRSRLVLSPRDATEATLAGVDRSMSVGTAVPGRAVLVRPSGQRVVQVVDAEPVPPAVAPTVPTERSPTLRPLPREAPELPATAGERAGTEVALGVGGDTADPVTVPLAAGGVLLVVGPPGSGRTATLAALAARLAAAGAEVVRAGAADPSGDPGRVVVADDVDRLGPQALDHVVELPTRGARVLAAAATMSVLSAHRAPLTTWITGPMVVLRPDLPISGRLVPGGLGAGADPLAATVPGRAALVRSGRSLPVQIVREGDARGRHVEGSAGARDDETGADVRRATDRACTA
ncbi:FtsK/SpoIIIE domain-containing protein [Georgenia sp. Z1491]|uniref:FtsK/SpoIIIE domain-containing protein n=1 Tax=Georgenia sp. Z1491 TaxID=3416707 RepID=UPI003CF43F01